MYLSEQYYLYHFTQHLITNEHFQLIHFNKEKSEVWLSKTKWRQTKVIRLIHQGFDWRNHLKRDIALLFERVRNLRRHFNGKNIHVYNVYITDLEPVDDWKNLKRPLQLDERNPLKMRVFYITGENRQQEQERLLQELKLTSNYTFHLPQIEEQERRVQHYENEIQRYIYEKNKRMQHIFSFGKPRLTFILLYINLFIFLLLELNGGSTNIETLIDFGAKYNPAIVAGEWWRMITSMFLHIGLIHLMMNMLALYYLGTAVERIFGSKRFMIIYFLAGISGSLTSFAFNDYIAAGASGALFGLFGSLLFFGTVYRDLFRQTMGRNLLLILVINLVLGFIVPQIDMGAHLGGLFGGYIASAIVFVPNKKRTILQVGALSLYLLFIVSLTYYGYIKNIQFIQSLL